MVPRPEFAFLLAMAFREHPGFPRFSSLLIVDLLTFFGETVIRERRGVADLTSRRSYPPAVPSPP